MALSVNDIDIRKFYESIVDFENSDEARDFYYSVMDTVTGRQNADGSEETVRDRILKAYGMLFCEEFGLAAGQCAGPDEVAATADRLYIGDAGYDPAHWYRMKHHFPVIDDDNYDRFAALVISDMNAGPLHDAAVSDGDTLVVGEADPLNMTPQQRKEQTVRPVTLPAGGAN